MNALTERQLKALTLRKQGISFRKIGVALGHADNPSVPVSSCQARNICKRADYLQYRLESSRNTALWTLPVRLANCLANGGYDLAKSEKELKAQIGADIVSGRFVPLSLRGLGRKNYITLCNWFGFNRLVILKDKLSANNKPQ